LSADELHNELLDRDDVGPVRSAVVNYRREVKTMLSTRFRVVTLIAAAVSSISLAGRGVSEDKEKRPAAPDTGRLTEANFPAIFDALQPPRVEPWKSIPWHISIVEAAQQAEKEGKPVFLWQADGWPLGCG
jgi:hypothetical protein